jgi:hypothetical protein
MSRSLTSKKVHDYWKLFTYFCWDYWHVTWLKVKVPEIQQISTCLLEKTKEMHTLVFICLNITNQQLKQCSSASIHFIHVKGCQDRDYAGPMSTNSQSNDDFDCLELQAYFQWKGSTFETKMSPV